MKDSKIEWTDHTFNPWIGCTKVSPGCEHCYAETLMDTRWGRVKWGHGQMRQRTSAKNWGDPLRWNDQQERLMDVLTPGMARLDHPLPRPRVFCASLSDWLDDEVPIEWLSNLLDLIHRTPNLDWLLLTKRPTNWFNRVSKAYEGFRDASSAWMLRDWLQGDAPANVWLGTTVEDQRRADERIPQLLEIPARVRFLSCEPLLGPVDLSFQGGRGIRWNPRENLWVICGGESGPGARPMNPDWARSLRDQCAAAGVPFFFKQWGEWVPSEGKKEKGYFHFWKDGVCAESVGKKAAGRMLDGRTHDEVPK